jgi:hypothetical protein
MNNNAKNLGVPDLFNGTYDQYALNFTNAAMAGRGHTGVSLPSRIAVATHNPSALRSGTPHISIDVMIKNETKEFNQRYWYLWHDVVNETLLGERYHEHPYPEHRGFNPTPQRYRTSPAVGNFGIAFNPLRNENFNFGLSYDLKRSISYTYFNQLIINTKPQGIHRNYTKMTNPQFSEHQIVLTTNKQFSNLTVGINNNLHILHFSEYRAFGSGRSNVYFYNSIYRPQFGLLYELNVIQVGASFTPKTEATIGGGIIKHDTVFPTNIKTGLSLNLSRNARFLYDTDITLYSETSDYLNNRTTHKFGIENCFGAYTLRAGFINSPSIFEGMYHVPHYYTRLGNDFERLSVPRVGEYSAVNLQLLTFGSSILLTQQSNLHLAFLTDLADVGVNTFMVSIDFDFAAFKALRNR